jgi:DNA invertase Pin-like site-specific DNA recombinase
MTRVALYARASTADQDQSVPGQLRELREHAEREGWTVVEEVQDVAEKRHTAERPGIRRLRELGEAEEIDEVWAWAWDRYGEFPVPETLVIEFEDFGTALRSLDDGGESVDSFEIRAIKSMFSRKEQRSRKDRSRRGRTDKTLKGEIFGGGRPRYGFRYRSGPNQAGRMVNVGYEPNPETMPNVARVFEMLASGGSLRAVQREFEQAGIPNPSGEPEWSRRTIRNIVLDDVYRPHTFEEIEQLVTPGIAATLDPSKPYGVSWSGRKRSKFKDHKSKKRVVYETPREEWKALPIDLTGSGLDRATVDRARDAIKDNKSPSKVGDRSWELSGILKCAECGRNMIAYRRAKRGGGHNYYYRCRPSSTVDLCENRKSHPAECVEEEVHRALRAMVEDRELLTAKIRESFDAERRGLSRAVSDTAPLIERLAYLERRKDGYYELAADKDITREAMRKKVEEIDAEREGLQKALNDARHRDERLAELDREEERLLSVIEGQENPYVIRTIHSEESGTHRVIGNAYDFLVSDAWTPQARRSLYQKLGLRLEIAADGRITVDGTLIPPSEAGEAWDGEQKGALQKARSY